MKVRNPWTAQEVEALQKHFPTASEGEMLKHIPTRTLSAINEKANQLGVCMDPETKRKRLAERAKLLNNLGKTPHIPFVAPCEYIQAADIFQVGYRIAKDMGVVHEFC